MTMKLSIGPIQYFWEREQVIDFYQQAADSVAEIIYLGEVICSKRRLVKYEDWLAIGNELKQSGKEVILSSLTLLEALNPARFSAAVVFVAPPAVRCFSRAFSALIMRSSICTCASRADMRQAAPATAIIGPMYPNSIAASLMPAGYWPTFVVRRCRRP